MAVNNDLNLGVGNVSHELQLNDYYQDLREAKYHFEHNSLGSFDENGIPFLFIDGKPYYSIVYVIQYALILHDIYIKGGEDRRETIINSINWLEDKSENFEDSIVWRNEYNKNYDLKKGWVSGMYQGQAVSLFLRAYQMFNKEKYLDIAKKAFSFLKYDYSEGGTRREDENGFIWFEEYPTLKPSFVLNGFIYTMFGILDYYRVTKDEEAKELFNQCIETLENNLHKYDTWYWSVYDQLKKQLVSYYYQKNVHVPLMEILHILTGKEIFNKYAVKWKKNLGSKACRLIVQLMYRIQPRAMKFKSVFIR